MFCYGAGEKLINLLEKIWVCQLKPGAIAFHDCDLIAEALEPRRVD